MSLPEREITVEEETETYFVEFGSLEEAKVGALGPELLLIIKQLHGLAFSYNVMDLEAYDRLRKQADDLIKATR